MNNAHLHLADPGYTAAAHKLLGPLRIQPLGSGLPAPCLVQERPRPKWSVIRCPREAREMRLITQCPVELDLDAIPEAFRYLRGQLVRPSFDDYSIVLLLV
jgi:hypothetical protein